MVTENIAVHGIAIFIVGAVFLEKMYRRAFNNRNGGGVY